MGLIHDIFNWIKNDYRINGVRFILECIAWMLSIGCSLVMAVTVPSPPLFSLYPFWILGCSIYLWAAYTRGSFGMFANYLLLTSIDIVGYTRLWMTA